MEVSTKETATHLRGAPPIAPHNHYCPLHPNLIAQSTPGKKSLSTWEAGGRHVFLTISKLFFTGIQRELIHVPPILHNKYCVKIRFKPSGITRSSDWGGENRGWHKCATFDGFVQFRGRHLINETTSSRASLDYIAAAASLMLNSIAPHHQMSVTE